VLGSTDFWAQATPQKEHPSSRARHRTEGTVCKSRLFIAVALAAGIAAGLRAQTTPLLPDAYFRAIRDESSGERPVIDFRTIESRYTGFTPSRGGDQIAEYLAGRMREYGLSDVAIEGFPADGKMFFWTFLTEPAWEPEAGTLTMVAPRMERLADYGVYRVVLGRFSSNADVTADLVDVGAGLSASDYEGKDVKGKIVLATGEPGAVHAEAVWGRGAVGVLWYRTVDGLEFPTLVSNPAILPWFGPHGEPAAFSFGVSYAKGVELRDMLRRGEKIRLHAMVKATTGPGEYKQVNALIRGSDPSLQEVWVNAHDNYRNTGGGNNLTGVGTTIEIARVLRTLVANGTLPQPRRNIRFLWGAEHYSSVYNFYKHPDKRGRVLSMLNVDMAGYHQKRASSVFRVYRLPYSMPHFLNDVAEEFLRSVGRANSISIRNSDVVSVRSGPGFYDAVFAPTGSRDPFHYAIEEFWGPSDHEDVAEASIGVPAVLYNDWPDQYIGTQEDDISKADPTQLRRSVITVAATAYYLASLPPEGVTNLVPIMAGYAQKRLATEASRASALLTTATANDFATQHREGTNILDQAIARELTALDTLMAFGDSPSGKAAIARGRKQLESTSAANIAAFKEFAATEAAHRNITLQSRVPSAAERRLETLVPRRNETIRGPVHFFRPEYGLTWLRQKTKDDNFRSKVNLATRGHYVLYEALNFADGKRSLREIRDAVSAEYGPVDIADLDQYFKFLESVGVVSTVTAAQSGR
jgi:aminopeptidase YwaD